MPDRLFYESHCHTPLCHHAVGQPEDYAEAAFSRGLNGGIITCHCPLPDGFSRNVRMAPEEFDLYVGMVERAREAWAGRVDVRLGLESDFYPGVEGWLEKLHARVPLHHVLGSVHHHVQDYRDLYFDGDVFAYQQTYFEHLAAAAESGLFDTLAHPDLIKNEDPSEWDFRRIQPFIERALDRIAAAGVAMELNTSGRYKILPEINPGPEMLALMASRGIPVVLGADAHHPDRVGDGFPEALDALEAAGYAKVSLFLDRKRHDLLIPEVRASLA